MKWVVALALAVGAAGCKPESARRADRAAKDVVEQRNDLVRAAENVKADPVRGAKEVVAEADKLAKATREFEREKARRVAALHEAHERCATRAGMIGIMARDLPITDTARGEINEKLVRLQARLDETANMIEGLSQVHIDEWEARDDAVTEAMKRLEDAAQDTWETLEDAPRIAPNAS